MSLIIEIIKYVPFAIRRFFEKQEYLRPTLVATMSYDVLCFDEDEDGYEEQLTFYLLEFKTGIRIYDYVSYGQCAEADRHEEFLKDVMLWVHGGPLPSGSEKVGDATIMQLYQFEG